MAGLPSTLRFELGGRSVRVVHGTAGVVNRFVFASEHEALVDALDEAEADFVLAGHAGLPFLHAAGDGRVWLNAGVIGMPANDGTPDGWYTLIEDADAGFRVSFHRLTYDHLSAAARMRREGHANPYARTLITGRWPSLDILPATERAASGVRLAPAAVLLPLALAPLTQGAAVSAPAA
jgi:diadenosine tetraphosphatase ApaH/serine/threonine PP2A family protein phosphatase